MNIDIIKSMIRESRWQNQENNIVYHFMNDRDLFVYGKGQLSYSIVSSNNKIELRIGAEEKYNVEYVNDFILKLYNDDKSFRIMPE